MKRVVLSFGIAMICASALMAGENPPYRSTNVVTTDLFNVFVASGAINVKRVVINTTATGSFRLFNGSASTGTAKAGPSIDTSAGKTLDYDMVFSSGLMYGKIGAADVTLVWDWWKAPTLGRETVGR